MREKYSKLYKWVEKYEIVVRRRGSEMSRVILKRKKEIGEIKEMDLSRSEMIHRFPSISD